MKYVITENFMFNLSTIRLISNTDKDIHVSLSGTSGDALYKIKAFDEETLRKHLRQCIGNSEFNPSSLGSVNSGVLSPTDSDISKENTDFAIFIYLVRDTKGNIKLCDTQTLIRDKASIDVIGANSDATISDEDRRINQPTFLFNNGIRLSNSVENSS